MFQPTKNDGYYQLGLETAAVIRQAIANGRPVVHTTAIESAIDKGMTERGAGIDLQTDASSGHGSDLLL
jgi:hypothetical protein